MCLSEDILGLSTWQEAEADLRGLTCLSAHRLEDSLSNPPQRSRCSRSSQFAQTPACPPVCESKPDIDSQLRFLSLPWQLRQSGRIGGSLIGQMAVWFGINAYTGAARHQCECYDSVIPTRRKIIWHDSPGRHAV